MGKTNLGFRSWYYFRTGWSTYFAFILAALNTLTVTYFLSIDNYPRLITIIPSFELYVIIIVSIGIPMLVTIGYIHFKRTHAFKSEIDVLIESNPYQKRNTVNGELNLKLNLKIISMLAKISRKEPISEKDQQDLEKLYEKIATFLDKRTFTNDSDLTFLQNEIRKK